MKNILMKVLSLIEKVLSILQRQSSQAKTHRFMSIVICMKKLDIPVLNKGI